MSRNTLFLAVVGGAIVLAALMGSPGSDDKDYRIEVKHDGGRDSSSVEFNGKDYKCDTETGQVTLTHDDGSETVVICD
jgi:hypothetical protein